MSEKTNGAKNAALLALEIMAVSDPALAEKLETARREDKAKTLAADREIRDIYKQI